MNTRNTAHVEKKIQRAIEFLELLQHPQTNEILDFLQSNGESDFTELLIRFPKGNIQDDLDRLVSSGILLRSDSYLQSIYRINREKLERVFRATTPVFKVPQRIDVAN